MFHILSKNNYFYISLRQKRNMSDIYKYIIQTKDLIKGSLYYYRIIFHLHIDI